MNNKKSIKNIQFTKMQALGNDFMIINTMNQKLCLSKEIICNLSNRNIGVGFDQLLLIQRSNNDDIDFFCRIFNADGNEVAQCGNGIRCCAAFVYFNKLIDKKKFSISTSKRRMICEMRDNGNVIVDMGEPEFTPRNIPFLSSKINNYYSMYVNNQVIYFGVVSFGNPHCIIVVNDINDSNINVLGPLIEKNILFPDDINVGFIQILDKNHIKLRVYERGVGETQACGSGACAAVSVGINQKLLHSNVQVDLIGGKLRVNWRGIGNVLYMDGPAVHVYDGIISI